MRLAAPAGAAGSGPDRLRRGTRQDLRGVRRFFAPGPAASAAASPGGAGGPPADVAEVAAPLGRPSRAAGVGAVEVAAPAPAAGVETEAFNQAGSAASIDVEPVRRGHRCVTRRADVLGRRRPREPFHTPASRRGHLALRTCTVPAKPRWLLAIPDAISQLENLDRQLFTRRDIERLFGVGKVRTAALMKTFGAELVGNQMTPAADEAPAAAEEAPGAGRVPCREGTRAPGRRAPAGPADRVPVQGARRDLEREAVEPARWGVGRARPDRGAVRRGRGRPGSALHAGPGGRERSRALVGR